MSSIINASPGTVVYPNTYNNPLLDALKRMNIDQSVLPCIHYGLQVTPGAALTVDIAAGGAKGQDITFTQLLIGPTLTPVTLTLPTDVLLPAVAGLAVPANTTGYIVLNVNITPDPTVSSINYTVEADNNASPTPVITPDFVTTLQPEVGIVYPYTQIVLAKVVSGASTITSIDQTYSLGNRSYDFAVALASAIAPPIPTGFGGPFWGVYDDVDTTVWLPWIDGTFGNATSGGTILASAATEALFIRLWNASADVDCPVSGGRGVSADADFAANKTITTPRAGGVVVGIAGAGTTSRGVTTTTRDFAEPFGEEGHAMLKEENAPHDHTFTLNVFSSTAQGNFVSHTQNASVLAEFATDISGSGTPHNTIQPTTWVNWIVKL